MITITTPKTLFTLPEYMAFLPTSGIRSEWGQQPDGTPFLRLSSEETSEAELTTLAANIASLALNVASAAIIANGTSNTLISLPTPQRANYRILRYNLEIALGTTPDGAIAFSTIETGTYYIELATDSGQTGYAKVEAHAS